MVFPILAGCRRRRRRCRDYLIDNGIAVVSEDSWAGQIATAAVAHFAASTPEEYLINSTDLMNYNTPEHGGRIAEPVPVISSIGSDTAENEAGFRGLVCRRQTGPWCRARGSGHALARQSRRHGNVICASWRELSLRQR